MWLTYTWQDSKIMQAGSGLASTQGKEIDHIPNHMGSGGIDYKITPELLFNVWANYQNNYFIERTNTAGRFGGFIVGNLGLSYQATKRINFEFQIRNVNDARYEYAWWDGTQSLHSPAAGRSFYGGVILSF